MILAHAIRPLPLVASLALLLSLPASNPAQAQPGALLISEILPGPARDWDQSGAFSSRDDEWIEVVNEGATPLVLDGFFVTDGDSIPRYAFTGALAPGERRVVFGRESWDWERATGHPAFGLSLGNSGDAVMLWRITGSDTTLVDSYAYRSHEAASDRSIARLVPSGAWSLFDGLNPYTGTIPPMGNGCSPSPQSPNTCGCTPAAAGTWGQVKSRYR